MLNHKRIVALVLCFALALTVIGAALAYDEIYTYEKCGGVCKVGQWKCILTTTLANGTVHCNMRRVDNCVNGHTYSHTRTVYNQHNQHTGRP